MFLLCSKTYSIDKHPQKANIHPYSRRRHDTTEKDFAATDPIRGLMQ